LKQSFREYLEEAFKNFLVSDRKEKEAHADEVFAMLQASYANIGGLKGSGFGSAKEMISAVPMWKLAYTKGQLAAVVMYKDKAGRKLVAIGTDGKSTGKKRLVEILKVEFARSFAEISGPLLKFMERNLPGELKRWHISTSKVEEILSKKITIIDDVYYTRKLGGEEIRKTMLGTIGKSIT